jgi:hypothetical protein
MHDGVAMAAWKEINGEETPDKEDRRENLVPQE